VALFVALYVSYIGSSGVLVAWISLSLPLPPFTAIILSVEQVCRGVVQWAWSIGCESV